MSVARGAAERCGAAWATRGRHTTPNRGSGLLLIVPPPFTRCRRRVFDCNVLSIRLPSPLIKGSQEVRTK